MSNIFPDDFHLRCAHSPNLVFTVFQLLMNNDLIRSYACLALMLTMNLQAHGLRCMSAYDVCTYILYVYIV